MNGVTTPGCPRSVQFVRIRLFTRQGRRPSASPDGGLPSAASGQELHSKRKTLTDVPGGYPIAQVNLKIRGESFATTEMSIDMIEHSWYNKMYDYLTTSDV